MSVSRQSEWQVSYRAWHRELWLANWRGIGICMLVMLVGVLAMVALVLETVHPFAMLAAVLCLLGAVAFAPGWIVWNSRQEEQERLAAALADLNEFDPLAERWFIDLTLTDGNAIAGRDMGVLWFDDGRMNFMGSYCSFSLTPHDLAMQKYALDRWVTADSITVPITEKGYCGYRCLVMREVPPVELSPLQNRPLRAVVEGFSRAGERTNRTDKADRTDKPEVPAIGVRSAAWYAITGDTVGATTVANAASPPITSGQFPPLGLGPGGRSVGPHWKAGRAILWGLTAISILVAFSSGGILCLFFFPGILAIVERDAIDSSRDFRALKWRDRQKARQILATE